MNSDIKIGNLYYISYQYYENYTPIISEPKNWEETKVLNTLVSKQIFIPLEIKEIEPPDMLYHDENKIWLKILCKDIVGWIKVNRHEIYELYENVPFENVYLLD